MYLNVYTPSLDENANLSVIVLLDGGIFMAGPKFATNPSLIMDLQEFIYVTLYYRLGILGNTQPVKSGQASKKIR